MGIKVWRRDADVYIIRVFFRYKCLFKCVRLLDIRIIKEGLIYELLYKFRSYFPKLSGVYMEKALKQSSSTVWMQNIRLALFGIAMSCCLILYQDYEAIKECK
jgi:hypothetical protein